MRIRILAVLMTALLLLSIPAAYMEQDGFSTVYTYNYDYWSDIRESPDAYKVSKVLYSSELGLDKPMNKPQSLYVCGNDLYVADTGNNRIIVIAVDDGTYTVKRVIDSINGSDVNTFNTPSDVYADENGNIYVADTNNNRVVMIDSELNFVKQFTKPTDATFDQSLSFLPRKIVVDVAGRVYVLATNVNKGLVKFEADTNFAGFIGANKVSYNLAEYIWKSYFMSEAQRSQTESFVPTEYENIYIDNEGFIYATNIVFSEYDLKWDNAKPIRRLNGVGNDILIKNDRYPPIGDQFWVEGSDKDGPSKFIDITVLENDIYVAFDKTRGRIFGYDSQGILLWAFGTRGNMEGAFLSPSSIEHIGRDLFCLDQNEGSITVFTPTEYGNLIYDSIALYTKGDYDGSADSWYEVLKYNANYNMAFRGIGRALLRQDRFEEAMDYFEMANDRENYGRAFKLYRKEWVEKNIGWVVGILGALIVVWLIKRVINNARWEVYDYERNKVNK